ncbi:MAG TPA: extracellular solute-binding protein [Streptosporangiaceae bacterium]|nr:extracellular solute-binding protein [Streptosporangiaceae bacterium]
MMVTQKSHDVQDTQGRQVGRSPMRARRSSGRRWTSAMAAVACAGLAVAACSSGSSTSSSGGAKPSGTADVAYAGSLAYLNEKLFGPAFTKATGYAYQGRGAGSDALSAEIASGEITPNVFQSVGGDPITALEPKFTKWYIRYAATSIVVAYNPKSKYASQFAAIASGKAPLASLFTLMAKPGFKLGRTDPNIDPQGRSFIFMLELAQAKYHLPAGIVSKILGVGAGAANLGSANSPTIFEETALDARLQAGQLDAASAYLSQAIQLHLKYITLPADINLGDFALETQYAKASVTITGNVTKMGKPIVLDVTTIGTKDQAAADAFVKYLLSPAGRAVYQQGGYTLLTPTAFGAMSSIPASIRHELGG